MPSFLEKGFQLISLSNKEDFFLPTLIIPGNVESIGIKSPSIVQIIGSRIVNGKFCINTSPTIRSASSQEFGTCTVIKFDLFSLFIATLMNSSPDIT